MMQFRTMIRIAILASGHGSNAQQLMERFHMHPGIEVALVGCDRPQAGVVQRAWDAGVPSYLFNRTMLNDGTVLKELQALQVDLVVLAGFLRKIPTAMVQAYPDRIVNIHPALLPKHGGKGMFGDRVHAAVIASGETESGITIHLVNERYDEGRILFQARCEVLPDDDPSSLARRIHALEHLHFPHVVEELALRLT